MQGVVPALREPSSVRSHGNCTKRQQPGHSLGQFLNVEVIRTSGLHPGVQEQRMCEQDRPEGWKGGQLFPEDRLSGISVSVVEFRKMQ